MWTLFLSCMRVFKSGAATCNNATETCCTLPPSAMFTPVWSMVSPDGTDHLVTVDSNEHRVLVASGWTELCAPFGMASEFCKPSTDQLREKAAQYIRGPFLILSSSSLGAADHVTTTPLYRCIDNNGKHLASRAPDCYGKGKSESLMGYVHPTPSSNTPRALRVCDAGNGYYTTLDTPCDPNTTQLDLIGFVH